jgi:uncharacterized protein YecE (DUF72 family)
MHMARVYVGTCSWSENADFFPSGLPANQQITYYSERFPVVELDASFYRILPRHNYEAWSARTPDGFLFDVKPFRQLTWHDRDTPPNAPTFDEFRASLQPLRDAGRLGVLAFQFPPWFKRSEPNMEFIEQLPIIFHNDRVAVEFRHRSWLEETERGAVVDWLRRSGVGLTVVDEPQVGSGTVPIVLAVSQPDTIVVRFHGRNRAKWYAKVKRASERFDYLYSESELAEWIPRLSELAQGAQNIHVLFNNNLHNYSIVNAIQMRRLIQRAAREELQVVPPAVDEDYPPKSAPVTTLAGSEPDES